MSTCNRKSKRLEVSPYLGWGYSALIKFDLFGYVSISLITLKLDQILFLPLMCVVAL